MTLTHCQDVCAALHVNSVGKAVPACRPSGQRARSCPSPVSRLAIYRPVEPPNATRRLAIVQRWLIRLSRNITMSDQYRERERSPVRSDPYGGYARTGGQGGYGGAYGGLYGRSQPQHAGGGSHQSSKPELGSTLGRPNFTNLPVSCFVRHCSVEGTNACASQGVPAQSGSRANKLSHHLPCRHSRNISTSSTQLSRPAVMQT